jgi:hypothetical protein
MGSKMGILRYIVLGAVGFALLPTPPASQLPQGEAATPVAKLETHTLLSAAIGTVADVATFCARQPQTCEAMASVASVAEAKAKYSLKLAYEWANGQPIAAPSAETTVNPTESPACSSSQWPAQDRHALQPSAELGASASRSAGHRQHITHGRNQNRYRHQHLADRRPHS